MSVPVASGSELYSSLIRLVSSIFILFSRLLALSLLQFLAVCRKLFKKAKELAPCVVFIDEIDVVGADRDNEEYKSRYTLQQLLVEMDGYRPPYALRIALSRSP